MVQLILSCLWYLVPAALGNCSASFGDRLLPGKLKKYFAKFAKPVDFGLKWGDQEIFGKNKTWRGLFVGVLIGIIITGIQTWLFVNNDFFKSISIIDYERVNFIFLGILMGGGALLGDLVASFIKRRLQIPSGKSWFPWDQLDWILGAVILSLLVFIPSFEILSVTIIIYTLIHLTVDRFQLITGIKNREEVV